VADPFGERVLCARGPDRVEEEGRSRRETYARLRTEGSRASPEQLLAKVGKKYGISPARLTGRGDWGLMARNVAMWLVWEHSGLTLAQIGNLFGGLDYAAVAQRIRRGPHSFVPEGASKIAS
jgi:Bacterial dnaA protein helix-turn-helix